MWGFLGGKYGGEKWGFLRDRVGIFGQDLLATLHSESETRKISSSKFHITLCKMFVKFVPLHNGEVKHTKMQVDQDENLSDLREKLKSNFKAEHFKVLFHGRLINDFEKTLSHYKV